MILALRSWYSFSSMIPASVRDLICSRRRSLAQEQIKSLKDAGIIDEKEYQERRAKIMAGR